MVTYPFLQFPGLTPGQKRYLYAVDEAYGKDRVRKLIQQHYMNVIRRAVRTGVRSPEWPSADTDLMANLQLRTCTPEVQHGAKLQKKHSGAKANRQKPQVTTGTKTLVLPKIGHRQSLTSRDPETNVSKSKQTKKKSNSASTRPVRREPDMEWDVMEGDSLLSDISSLSLSEELPDII